MFPAEVSKYESTYSGEWDDNLCITQLLYSTSKFAILKNVPTLFSAVAALRVLFVLSPLLFVCEKHYNHYHPLLSHCSLLFFF